MVRAYSVYIQDLKNIINVKGCRDGRHAKKYANKVGMI